MRNRIIAAIAGLAIAAGTLMAAASPAAAAGETCVNHVTHYASWGSVRVCIKSYDGYYAVNVRTDDTLTDGQCVAAQVHVGGAWLDTTDIEGSYPSTSCGPVTDTGLFLITSSMDGIRLVRGNVTAWLAAWPD